jgi:P-type Ca2+ transporter type 2C
MGERGTDVAREAAALVLLDDSFASIIDAIRRGRHMDDNIRAAMRFVFAVHVPVIALALGPAILHWPLLLLPTQIVLLELIIDPACSILFESEPQASDVMQRAPRKPTDSPFASSNLAHGLMQGFGFAAVLLLSCWATLEQGWTGAVVRTVVFLALVGGLFLLALAHRVGARGARGQHNAWLPRLFLGVIGVMALLLGVPWLRQVLGFALPSWSQAAAVPMIWVVLSLWLLLVSWFASGILARASLAKSY